MPQQSEKTRRNVATLREAYRLWADTKAAPEVIDHIMSLFDTQVRLASSVDGARPAEVTPPHATHEGVRAYFEGIIAGWTMNYHRMEDYVAEGDKVVVIGDVSWTNRITGKPMAMRLVDIWQFNDAGKVVAYEEVFDVTAFAAAGTPDVLDHRQG